MSSLPFRNHQYLKFMQWIDILYLGAKFLTIAKLFPCALSKETDDGQYHWSIFNATTQLLCYISWILKNFWCNFIPTIGIKWPTCGHASLLYDRNFNLWINHPIVFDTLTWPFRMNCLFERKTTQSIKCIKIEELLQWLCDVIILTRCM